MIDISMMCGYDQEEGSMEGRKEGRKEGIRKE
jgi:hypothetical protein